MCYICKENPKYYAPLHEAAQVGRYGTRCQNCDQPAIIMRVGLIHQASDSIAVTCKCLACRLTVKAQVAGYCFECEEKDNVGLLYIIDTRSDGFFEYRCATCGELDESG